MSRALVSTELFKGEKRVMDMPKSQPMLLTNNKYMVQYKPLKWLEDYTGNFTKIR